MPRQANQEVGRFHSRHLICFGTTIRLCPFFDLLHSFSSFFFLASRPFHSIPLSLPLASLWTADHRKLSGCIIIQIATTTTTRLCHKQDQQPYRHLVRSSHRASWDALTRWRISWWCSTIVVSYACKLTASRRSRSLY